MYYLYCAELSCFKAYYPNHWQIPAHSERGRASSLGPLIYPGLFHQLQDASTLCRLQHCVIPAFFLRGVIPAGSNKISIHWKTQWQILLAASPKSIAILLYYDIWKIVTEIVIKQILQKARQSDRRNSYPPFFSDHTLWKSMITWITRSRCPVEQSIDRVPQQMTRDIICYDSVSVITCRTA